MDISLLKEFRDKVSNLDLIYHIYRNRNQKNQWNVICSAMDWISIVVEDIDTRHLQRNNSNAASIKVMNFIMCIDVLWEAVQQLHRVLFGTHSIPFESDGTCFCRKIASTSDNNYFKMLRACFAAHPVNLEDYFGDCTKKERRYASWSSGGLGPGDFSVILYSNELNKEPIFLDIWFDELLVFAQKRYEYLRTLMTRIDSIATEFFANYQNRRIEKIDDPLEQLQILKQESVARLNNDYYNYRIERLKLILETNIADEENRMIVQQYQTVCRQEINVLFDALQTMNFDLQKRDLPTEPSVPEKCRYAFSKVSDAVWGEENPCLIPLSSIKEVLAGVVQLESCRSIQELYVVIISGFYALQIDTNIQNDCER
ncbi:MAG: hypothetical protein ACLR8L_14680 [Oscillospiraceae bacterium]